MSLQKILSISGKPGLYELKAQTRGGFVAESLADKKKISVNVRHNVSMLSEIAIYTHTEEVPLAEVFQKLADKEEGKESLSHKSSANELTTHFKEVLPDFDEGRVYASDIKKVYQWYNILVNAGVNTFVEETPEAEEKSTEE
ncbi:MAG: DUF5606 family protein [Mesonia hippocampi]|uniref:DUF5606 family protein n=1 Tax=Mesonia hippocampi TaxID=1628250 RepID=UPI003F952B9E